MTTPDLPPGLPPLPPVPEGFDRWRRTCDPFATGPLIRLCWPTGWKQVKQFDHDFVTLEAVREPAKDQPASGVEARVCEGWRTRFEQWAGIDCPDDSLMPFSGVTIWPIIDRETCGPIDGFPREDQFFAVAFTSASQAVIANALNKPEGRQP